MTITNLQDALAAQGYRQYTRPYELNIVGIRADSTQPNLFDDSINVFYRTKDGSWQLHQFAATTDPGTYWLENPLNPQGTAILKAGQYIGSHSIGMHRGKYEALVQVRNVTVLRDYDRKAVLDFMNGKEDTGLFGINIHHALAVGTTRYVDKFSAGCQVFASMDDFNVFMQLCYRHRELYGNAFTYTLIDNRALIRASKKN